MIENILRCQLKIRIVAVAIMLAARAPARSHDEALNTNYGGAVGEGTVYYVARTGSNTNPGTKSKPWASINHAVHLLHPGDTLYIRAGVYAEALIDAIPGGKSWSQPVTVTTYPGEKVTLRPRAGVDSVLYFAATREQYIIVKGLVLDGSNVKHDVVKITWGAQRGAASYIRLVDDEIENAHKGQGILITNDPATGHNVDYNEILRCKIHDNGANPLDHGIYINSSHNLVDGNDIYHNSGHGIQIYRNDKGYNESFCSYNIVRNNRVHDNDTATMSTLAIVVANGKGNLLYNNLVYGNAGGIQIGYGANKTRVFNNTVYNNKGASWGAGILVQPSATETVVKNNICCGNGAGGRGDYSEKSHGVLRTLSDYNITGDATGYGPHSLRNTNPQFVDAMNGDFHLRHGSPAIGAGTHIADVRDDFDHTPRPKGKSPDVGAYQFKAGSR